MARTEDMERQWEGRGAGTRETRTAARGRGAAHQSRPVRGRQEDLRR